MARILDNRCYGCVYHEYILFGWATCRFYNEKICNCVSLPNCTAYMDEKELKEMLDKLNRKMKPIVEDYCLGVHKAIKGVKETNEKI